MAVSICELEAIAAKGWRAPEEAPLGGWMLRAARGFTGRANSALAAGDPGIPLAAAMTSVRRWYAARDLPAGQVELCPEPGRAWLDRYYYRGRELPPIARQLLVSAPFQAFASIR